MNDAFGLPNSVLVLGGTSDIARALVRELVGGGAKKVVLAGRDATGLAAAADEAKEAGADFVATLPFDANDVDQAAAVVDSGFSAVGRVDLVVIAVGLLYDDEADERDPARVARCVTVNFTWPAAALSRIAHHLREQGAGRVVVLSSVAGVRVRRSNYIYGSAKAGLDAYARSLNQALFEVTPEAVASDIVKGIQSGSEVVWSPSAMRPIFFVLGLLPQPVWRRLPL